MNILRLSLFSYQLRKFVINESSTIHSFAYCIYFPRSSYPHGSNLLGKNFTASINKLSSSSISTSNVIQRFESLEKYNANAQFIFPPESAISSSFIFQLPPKVSTETSKVDSKNETASTDQSEKSLEPRKPKKSVWARVKEEVMHYYHGFRLLGLEVKIAGGICFQLLTGKSLSRRERNQLVRTSADIFRLVPFAIFIIVPFMEFLLPVYLKFFPFMLPSTFKEKGKEEEKMRQVLKAKLEMAKFLQETIQKTGAVASQQKDALTITEFQDFLKTVRQSGQLAKTSDIVKFSHLFEDQFTLDSLAHDQLKALCQLLEISALGPSQLLRFQLRLRVRQLRAEDILLAKEGVQNIQSWELQSLSRARGMRSLGLTEERLRKQLKQWLVLHLERNIPISLLLLSRVMYVQDATLPPEQQLQRVISVLPEAVAEEATVKAVEASEDVDPKMKIEILRKEQASIKAEKKAEQKRHLEEKAEAEAREAEAREAEARKAEALPPEPLMVDKAEILKTMNEEKLIDYAKVQRETQAADALKTDVKIPQPPSTPEVTEVAKPPPATLTTPLKAETVPEQIRVEQAGEKQVKIEETTISAKDLDSIAAAIGKVEELNKAMQDEHLNELKDEVKETAKLRKVQLEQETKTKEEIADLTEQVKLERAKAKKQQPDSKPAVEKEVEAGPAPSSTDLMAEVKAKEQETKAKQAEKAKAEKAARRIGAQVDKLLQDLDGLMEKLDHEKEALLDGINKLEAKAETTTVDVEKQQIFDSIRADQERLVDINDIIVSLHKQLDGEEGVKPKKTKSKSTDSAESPEQLQLTANDTSERWQRILDALDEDHDGKIELKHVLALVKLLDSEKVTVNMKQMSEIIEMLEQEELAQETMKAKSQAAVAETETSGTSKTPKPKEP